MSEVDTIKAIVTLREVARGELAYGAEKQAKNWDLYICPFHNERSPSFSVRDDIATCFGACNKTWDVFSFVQQVRGISFGEAKKYLIERYTAGIVPVASERRAAPAPRATMSEPPNAEWQLAAARVVETAKNTLWSPAGKPAMDYLRQQRGLNGVVIDHADLGYIPGAPTEWRKIEGLNVPCGILIPWIIDGVIWGLKVRRAAGKPKYMQVSGGKISGALYWAGEIEPGKPLIIDEGEFNTLAMWQSLLDAGLPASVVAIGSTGNAALNLRWYPAIAAAPRVYTRMDDGTGDNAARILGSLSAAARPLGLAGYHNHSLPVEDQVKDPNEALLVWGEKELAEWIAWETNQE